MRNNQQQQHNAAQELRATYRRLFDTIDGVRVMEDLTAMYGGEMVTPVEHHTMANVGSRRVLDYINEQINEATNE